MNRRHGPLVVAGVLWAAALVFAAASARVLYGDGAWYVLVHLITPNRFNDYDFQRTFASLISQAPVLFGQRMGVDSVAVYAALYAFGIFVIPAVAMFTALVLARRQPALFAAVALGILVYGFGTNFINTEANLLFGFAWLAVVIIAMDRPAPMLRGIVLPAIGIALLRCYEGMLLVGPVLGAWAAVCAARTDVHKERIGLVLAALLFFLGATIGLGGFLSPRDPNNASGFVSSAFAYLGGPHAFLLASGIAAMGAALLRRRRVRLAALLTSAVLGACFVAGIVRIEGYYGFSVYYYNRSFMVLLLPVLVAAVAAAHVFRPSWLASREAGWVHAAFLVPLAFAVAGDVAGTMRWRFFVDRFCDVLEAKGTPQDRVQRLRGTGARTAWAWTHPTMSVLLRDRGSRPLVANEPGASSWQPFQLAAAPTIPYRGLCQAPLLGAGKPEGFGVATSFLTGRYPGYVAAVEGVSKPEGWATWSEGPVVRMRFTRPLPVAFELNVRIAAALGENRTLPIVVRAGGVERQFVADRQPTDAALEFEGVAAGTTALEFVVPKPVAPSELGMGADDRKLGIALVSLAVTPK